MPLLPFERRWRDTLLAATLPADATRPGLEDLDLAAFWPRFEASSPPLLALGLRAATWGVTFAPVWLDRRLTLFPSLSADEQDAVLQRVAEHRWYPVRQLATTLGLVATFAWFADPSARESVE